MWTSNSTLSGLETSAVGATEDVSRSKANFWENHSIATLATLPSPSLDNANSFGEDFMFL
jgi:hypothetical protein